MSCLSMACSTRWLCSDLHVFHIPSLKFRATGKKMHSLPHRVSCVTLPVGRGILGWQQCGHLIQCLIWLAINGITYCAAGPVPHSIIDFWRMVWEQASATIVMLTALEEKGRVCSTGCLSFLFIFSTLISNPVVSFYHKCFYSYSNPHGISHF